MGRAGHRWRGQPPGAKRVLGGLRSREPRMSREEDLDLAIGSSASLCTQGYLRAPARFGESFADGTGPSPEEHKYWVRAREQPAFSFYVGLRDVLIELNLSTPIPPLKSSRQSAGKLRER